MRRLAVLVQGIPKKALAAVLVVLLAVGGAVAIRATWFGPVTITAYFPTVTSIYQGDDVRVAGMKVGSIAALRPEGTTVRLVLHVDRHIPIPADARAVIVAQNLVASRYVQLTPAYRASGPTMRDGAVIPVARTASPVEWDQVKDQLMRIASDLGPKKDATSTSVSRFIDSAADALGGDTGHELRESLTQLAGLGRILANGSGSIVDVIKNLQTFVSALRDSNVEIVQFNNHLATLSSVLDDNTSDLDAALTNLSTAVVDIQRFVVGTREATVKQVGQLRDLTQILVDDKSEIKNILHTAPNALSNSYNGYDPDLGGFRGAVAIQNYANPIFAYCSTLGALENATANETGKLCGLYLTPALRVFNPLTYANFNQIPIPLNPLLEPAFDPSNVRYAEDRLAPGGIGPRQVPPELPPAVSAYSGLPGDTPDGPPPPPPPGRIPGAALPEPPPTAPAPTPAAVSGGPAASAPTEGTQR